MAEAPELNLWSRHWRDERISQARDDFRRRDIAFQSLQDKSTEYARSLQAVRDVCAQVLALWEASPVDLPADGAGACAMCDAAPGAAHSPACAFTHPDRPSGVKGEPETVSETIPK